MMAKAKRTTRDRIYTRKDRSGYWISWTDAQGRRRYRRTDAESLAQARNARAAELIRVEQAKILGFTPPREETFSTVADRYINHQKVRLTPNAFDREKGIIEHLLKPFFVGKLAAIRRVDIQRYVTRRSGEVSSHTTLKGVECIETPTQTRHGVGDYPYQPGARR